MYSERTGTLFLKFHLAVSICLALLCIFAFVWYAARAEQATALKVILGTFHALLSVIAFAYTFGRWPWLYGTIPCFLVAMILTPSPALMLVVACPLVCIYLLAVRRSKKRHRQLAAQLEDSR